jgi:hypothetical protein
MDVIDGKAVPVYIGHDWETPAGYQQQVKTCIQIACEIKIL